MATAKNMSELAKQIEAMARKAMQRSDSETSKVVIETGEQHVQSDVYDTYEPKMYERTGELKESWEVENTEDGIAVFNTREDDGKYIPEVIETGKGYDYQGYGYGYEKERPFVSNTREELRNGNQLSQALKRDFEKMGIKTK
jgi:hypothetical protein